MTCYKYLIIKYDESGNIEWKHWSGLFRQKQDSINAAAREEARLSINYPNGSYNFEQFKCQPKNICELCLSSLDAYGMCSSYGCYTTRQYLTERIRHTLKLKGL